ncbi:MAG: tRNA threonylcarbamoyladenosine biosynthesis protein, partial [bacterium]
EYFQTLIKNFWPGPLTMVLPASDLLPSNLISPEKTVGVRYPDYIVAQELAKAIGGVITATSANLSGQANTETPIEVKVQFGSSLGYILDGGKSPGGEASSVVDLTSDLPILVREGRISRTTLVTLLGNLA